MHSDAMLRLIAAFRISKAALLIGAGIALLRTIRIPEWITRFPRAMTFVARLESPHYRHLLAPAMFAYAALFIVEGAGLWMGKVWAEYLTVIATASFLPFEIYEAMKHVTALRLTVLVINAAILVYLIFRIRGSRARPRLRST